MELAGLINRITNATTGIDYGRKGFAIRGKAEEGRISYETGISEAMSAFKEAQATDTIKAGQEGYLEMQKKALLNNN